MVYDNTKTVRTVDQLRDGGERGFAIHEGKDAFGYPEFEIYTDNGFGDGEYVCTTRELSRARHIAELLNDDLTVAEREPLNIFNVNQAIEAIFRVKE